MTIDLDVKKENLKKSYALEKQMRMLAIGFLFIAALFVGYSFYYTFNDEVLVGVISSLTASLVFFAHGQSQLTKSIETIFSSQGYSKKIIHDQTYWEDHYHFLYQLKDYRYDEKTEHLEFSVDLKDISNIHVV